MESIIVATHVRGTDHYIKVNQFPATIGRALDNDIILSDLSVSPHHLKIDKTENGDIEVTNISNENGTTLNKEDMAEGQGNLISCPSTLWLGHSKIRLLSPDMPVEPTKLWACSGIFCLLTKKLWAFTLTFILLGLFTLDHYLGTPVDKPISYFINESFTSVLYLIGFFLIIAGISRLATHRWDLVPALSIATLFFLVPKLFSYSSELINYYFSSTTFSTISMYLLDFFLLPVLLVLFMTRIAHSPLWPSIGVSLLVSSPFIALKAKELADDFTRPDFSQLPSYNKTLSSFDIRKEKSISTIDFLDQADTYLAEQIAIELEKANKEQLEEN